MTKKELLEIFVDTQKKYDPEFAHEEADKALIEFINDKEIEEAFNDMVKWYA